MSNINNPRGMIPLTTPQGDLISNAYGIVNDYATDIFMNDPVVMVAAGGIQLATTGSGNYVLGSAVSFEDETGVPQNYYPASSTAGWLVVVTDSVNQLYVMQENTVSGVSDIALADRGQNIDLVAGTGNTATGLSAYEINPDTMGTESDRQMKIIRKDDMPGNELGDDCNWVLKINYHQSGDNTAGV